MDIFFYILAYEECLLDRPKKHTGHRVSANPAIP